MFRCSFASSLQPSSTASLRSFPLLRLVTVSSSKDGLKTGEPEDNSFCGPADDGGDNFRT